jgi:hypothetical protein
LPQAFLVAFAFFSDADKIFFTKNSRTADSMTERETHPM